MAPSAMKQRPMNRDYPHREGAAGDHAGAIEQEPGSGEGAVRPARTSAT